MEAGKRAAGNGHEQQREHIARGSGKAGEGGGRHLSLAVRTEHHDAEHGADDHGEHHDGGQVVARGLQHLDGHRAHDEQVHGHHGKPTVLVEIDGEVHAHGKGEQNGDHGHRELARTLEVPLAASPAKEHGAEGEQDGDGARSARGIGLGGAVHAHAHAGGNHVIGLHSKGAGNHIDERGDDNDAEQPAEQQEQATTGLADVLLDELGQRLAVVLHARIERAEVMHGPEEDAAHEHPQHHGQPAKGHGHDGARHRAGTADRAELVRKHRERGGRGEVLAVLHAARWGDRIAFDTPCIGQPPSVEEVRADEHDGSHHHQHNSVHFHSFPRSTSLSNKKNGGCRLRSTASVSYQPPVSCGLAVLSANPH